MGVTIDIGGMPSRVSAVKAVADKMRIGVLDPHAPRAMATGDRVFKVWVDNTLPPEGAFAWFRSCVGPLWKEVEKAQRERTEKGLVYMGLLHAAGPNTMTTHHVVIGPGNAIQTFVHEPDAYQHVLSRLEVWSLE